MGGGALNYMFLVLAATGEVEGTGQQAILIFVQFGALFLAGYVAGRLGVMPVLDGGMAGMLVFVITVAISVAGGASLGVGALLFLGITAAVLGSAGGILAQFIKER